MSPVFGGPGYEFRMSSGQFWIQDVFAMRSPAFAPLIKGEWPVKPPPPSKNRTVGVVWAPREFFAQKPTELLPLPKENRTVPVSINLFVEEG